MSFGIDASSLLSSQYSSSTTGGTGGLRQFAGLNLTEQQRSQMRTILQNAKSQGTSQADVQQQLEQVLTPTQQSQFAASQRAQSSQSSQTSTNQATPGLFSNLNLTADQQTKIQTILADAKTNGTSSTAVKSQIDAVLTDSQKTQLAANVQNARASGSGHHRHHGGGGGADATSSTSSSTTASTTSSSGVTATDMQNQVLAALSVLTKYVQSQVTTG
jgi:periplasmic protein CpxP/Spy